MISLAIQKLATRALRRYYCIGQSNCTSKRLPDCRGGRRKAKVSSQLRAVCSHNLHFSLSCILQSPLILSLTTHVHVRHKLNTRQPDYHELVQLIQPPTTPEEAGNHPHAPWRRSTQRTRRSNEAVSRHLRPSLYRPASHPRGHSPGIAGVIEDSAVSSRR